MVFSKTRYSWRYKSGVKGERRKWGEKRHAMINVVKITFR